MKKPILAALVAIATLGVLIGCAGGAGKPRGPVDAFVFAAGTNPGLEQNAVGSLNMQKDPLEIYVVVPPDTDLRRLVATFSLNVEATISTISSGAKVIQQNGVTPNDFSAPVNYTVEVPKDKKPWRYRVTVRLAETNPRLAQLAIGDGAVLTPFLQREGEKLLRHGSLRHDEGESGRAGREPVPQEHHDRRGRRQWRRRVGISRLLLGAEEDLPRRDSCRGRGLPG